MLSKPLTHKPDHLPTQQPAAAHSRWSAERLPGALLRFFGTFGMVLATAILLAWLGTWSEEPPVVAVAQATAGQSAHLFAAHREPAM